MLELVNVSWTVPYVGAVCGGMGQVDIKISEHSNLPPQPIKAQTQRKEELEPEILNSMRGLIINHFYFVFNIKAFHSLEVNAFLYSFRHSIHESDIRLLPRLCEERIYVLIQGNN